jgi:hypothetical protein
MAHISDQNAPFHTKVINATVRDATHVLDGRDLTAPRSIRPAPMREDFHPG